MYYRYPLRHLKLVPVLPINTNCMKIMSHNASICTPCWFAFKARIKRLKAELLSNRG